MDYWQKHQQTFLSLMDQGGPIMWAILIVAIIAFLSLALQSVNVMILTMNAKRDYQGLLTDKSFIPSLNKNKLSSPVAQLIANINWQEIHHQEDITKEMNIHIVDIMPKLSNKLATIGVLGSILPMLGLLGTVTGMINVFEVIAIQGSGDAKAMADGISQAMLTTASGLIIAIPVIFLHHLVANRITVLMDVTGQAMQIILHRDISLFKSNFKNA